MAIVYAGIDTVLRRRVAIKVLRDALAADADFVARFYVEAQHAAKLSHPNIVNIYDVGREGDAYYIVMELVDGATLGEMIDNDKRLPEGVAIDFGAQICNGLAYAHRQGLLHRDIKPANILVAKDDVVKLSDFGIARAVTTQTMSMTQPGMVMGSVFYISPEQAQGHELGATSDLYSFGVVLYQMLSGHLPFTGESPITVALKHVSSPVPELDIDALGVSPALAAVVRKLLQKSPQDRFASATDVARALRQARETPSATTPFDVRAAAASSPQPSRTIPNPKPRPSRFPDRPTEAPAAAASIDAVRSGSNRVLVVTFVAIFALVAAAALGYVLTGRGVLVSPPTITLANVVGQRVEDAERALVARGLAYKISSTPSERVSAHIVMHEEPAAGTRLAAGTVILLDVSAGPPMVPLLDVRQFSSEDAQRYLRTAKLAPKIVRKYNDAPSGTVLSENPLPGTSVPVRSNVTLVVSQGPKPVSVPDLVSLSLDDASAAAAQRHLKLVVSERDPSDSIPADVVTSQNPQAGSTLDRDGTIAVAVSNGAPHVTLPYVGGESAADATVALGNIGIGVTIEYVVDPSAPLGTVLKQTPDPKTSAKKGSTVTLDVAVPGLVPDVSGKSPDDARTVLQSAGYQIGNSAFVQEGTEGTVARTEPSAGSNLRPGETVTLYVNGTSAEPQ